MNGLPKVKILLNSRGQARKVLVDDREILINRANVEWSAGNPFAEVDFRMTVQSVETRIDATLDDQS